MNADLLLATYSFVQCRADEFASEFYGQLFTRSREAHNLFIGRRVDMESQQRLLMAALFVVITGVKHDAQATMKAVQELGRRHASYGAPAEYYPLVGEVLIDTFRAFLGQAWTPCMEASWKEAFTLLQETMLAQYPRIV